MAGGLTFLAALRNRRRTLALALTLLVTTAAFEGVAHAALRLANVRHADTLSIGASVIPPVLVEGDAAPLGSSPLARVGQAPEHHDSQVTDAAVAFAKERAPPVSAAS